MNGDGVNGRQTRTEELSDRQKALLAFVASFQREHGYPPTNREIGLSLAIKSTGHVNYHLNAIEKKGYITRDPHKSRGIHLLVSLGEPEEPVNVRALPILGQIAAGEPIDTIRRDETLDLVNPDSYRHGAYALRVRGRSMIEDGIFDGDYVIIEPLTTPNTRDIIVATNTAAGVEGAATLKRFFREGDHIRLQPANSELQPFLIPAREWDRDWQVQGRVAAVVRSYRD